jgi:hypothetical protein
LELKKKDKRWITIDRTPFKIELPPYTLLLAERVQEHFPDVNIKYFSFFFMKILGDFLE